MTNNRHIPKRRFKEFESDSDWEETKLKELFQYIGNAFVGTATPYYVESGHFYLESNNIKDGQINNNTEVFINDEFYQKQKNKWLQTGDMVMVQSGHVGHAAVIPEYLNNSAAHALIMFRNPSENLESHFLNYQYQTTEAKEKIKTITTGNTIQHILASDMKEYKVYVSNLEEQKKIGNFFKTIDSLITLHQHKFDKLKNLKKSYLAELFPAEGERVPKRRFPDFEGEWEVNLLGELGKAQSGVGFPDSEQGGKVGVPFYKVSDMNNTGNEHEMVCANNYVTLEQINQRGWKPINDVPAIFFAKVGAAVLLNRKRLCNVPFLLDNNTMAFSIDTSKIDTNFAKTIFETIDLTALVQIGALPSYNAKDVESISVLIPSKNEQKQIGEFFQKIDRSISLQQKKLDKIKDLKKAYLNELFV